MPAGASLVHARLLIMDPPARVGGGAGKTFLRVPFQFNPNQLTLTKRTEWRRNPARMAEETSVPEFVGSAPRTLSVEIFLDGTDKHDDSVEQNVSKLLRACVPTPESRRKKRPASPWVKLVWGKAKTFSFAGVVQSVSVTYSLFDVDGTPLRARCSLTIDEGGSTTPNQNPTSGALEARRGHQVVAGDTLPALAWQEYGDATAWRLIAEANEVEDPMRLRPGTELLIPAQDEVS
ncbi:CIS tube protein [Amycolatopsis sp. CA-230715]|uniref:CIS tube protein n=1 Tax=Amycolatopsis sp. CA-230715 TaxID=2745196 RepID=UPI001C02BE5B|nr:LysM peptidoglycan-binding domain-containing protein [Amycolatopsis sp. CA-230715]QWF77829.1 hypothetical protein HUW46_01222 [Amycolatopsis sp. CA-230715]